MSRIRFLVAVALVAGSLGCGASAGDDANGGVVVEGRTDTGIGLSFDFDTGWREAPPGSTPFTKVYRNKLQQLEMRLADARSGGIAITTHGEQMRRGLGVDSTVEQSGPITIDGRPAYRVVVKKKTPTGIGIVVGTTVLRANDRIATVYLSSTADEKPEDRARIDAILATMEVR